MSSQKEVLIRWNAEGLRAIPEEILVNSRTEVLRWKLESPTRGARISRIVFDGEADGPFRVIGPVDASAQVWQAEGSKNQPFGRRYKYSVFVSTGGAETELDPFVVDTDRP